MVQLEIPRKAFFQSSSPITKSLSLSEEEVSPFESDAEEGMTSEEEASG